MPVKLCAMCQRRVDINPEDKKYLDRTGPFICSKPCIYNWIESQDKTLLLPLGLNGPDRTIGPADLGRPNEQYSHKLKMWFRSLFEMYFAEDIDLKGYEFEYEKVALSFKNPDGTFKMYVPDFYFTKYKCFVEVKGKWWASQRSKMNKFREHFPEVPLLTVTWLLEDVYYKNAGSES